LQVFALQSTRVGSLFWLGLNMNCACVAAMLPPLCAAAGRRTAEEVRKNIECNALSAVDVTHHFLKRMVSGATAPWCTGKYPPSYAVPSWVWLSWGPVIFCISLPACRHAPKEKLLANSDHQGMCCCCSLLLLLLAADG
jgi:hypothetical protein